MPDELRVDLSNANMMNIQLQGPQTHSITLNSSVQPGVRNYNNLTNLPQINGVTLMGNQSLSDLQIVSENTTDGWEAIPDYVPKNGEVCLFTDTNTIKIGDGNVAIGDLAFVEGGSNAEIEAGLLNHANNRSIHVSSDDRTLWDNKLNYHVSGEVLILTRN